MKNKYFTLLILPALCFCFCGNIFSQNNKYPSIDVSHYSSVDLNKPNATQEEIKNANENYHQQILQCDPQWDENRAAYEQRIQNFIANRKSNPTPQSVITIPVVVHILWHTAAENISDNQVFSQMIVLNEDFSRTNADTTNTPPPFDSVAANTGIQFCLAQQDPNGMATNGIERRQTSVAQFSNDPTIKFFSNGGLDQWDPTEYLNIWVCNSNYVNWGTFPSNTPYSNYGAVIDYRLFGSDFTVYGNFPNLISGDNGRIGDHEIGHCLNLYHIWGDDGTACTGTDLCADTPNQAGASSMCLTYPHLDSCTNSGHGIMFQNYMDYSYGDCKNLFTLQQSSRMNAVLSITPYNGLAFSTGCQAPSGISEIYSASVNIFPNPFTSSATFDLSKELKNAQLKLFDIVGKEVRSENFSGKQITLQREKLESGIYFYQISSENKIVSSGKLLAR